MTHARSCCVIVLLVIGTSEPEVEVTVGELAAWLITVARLFCQTY